MKIDIFQKIIEVIEKDIFLINERFNEKYLSHKQILKISKKIHDLELKIKKILTDETTPEEMILKKQSLLNHIYIKSKKK